MAAVCRSDQAGGGEVRIELPGANDSDPGTDTCVTQRFERTMSDVRYGVIALIAALLLPPLAAASAGADRLAVRLTQQRERTIVTLGHARPPHRLVLPAEEGIHAHSLGATRIIAQGRGRFVILVTDYASRPGGPTHQCGAGTETIVRVIAFTPVPHQTLAQRIASCWSTIEDGDVVWIGGVNLLTLQWTTYDPAIRHVRISYRVSADGEVSVLAALAP